MSKKQTNKAQRKLDQLAELDVLGALDNLMDLADPDSGGSRRNRYQQARLRAIQTIIVSIIIALSVILTVALVMHALREKWSGGPRGHDVNAKEAPGLGGKQANPSQAQAQQQPEALTQAAIEELINQEQASIEEQAQARQKLQWEYGTTADQIAYMLPASDGGVTLLTYEGEDYARISKLTANGKCAGQFGYTTEGMGKFLGLDGNGCSYFADMNALRKFSLTGQQVWELPCDDTPMELVALADGDLLLRTTMCGLSDPSVQGVITRLTPDGKPRWRHREALFLDGLQAAPDGTVYYYACPRVKKNDNGWFGPQLEQTQLCCLNPKGKSKWRLDLSFAKLGLNKQPLTFTARGQILLRLPPEADGGEGLQLIDSARGKQLHSYRDSIRCLAAAPDGTVYVLGAGQYMFAFDEQLTLKWQQELHSFPLSPFAVFPDSTVSCFDPTSLHAFSSTGKQLYRIRLPEPIYSEGGNVKAPLAGLGGLVFIPCKGRLLAYKHT